MKQLLINLTIAVAFGALAIYAAYQQREHFTIGGEWLLLIALLTAAVMWKGEKNADK